MLAWLLICFEMAMGLRLQNSLQSNSIRPVFPVNRVNSGVRADYLLDEVDVQNLEQTISLLLHSPWRCVNFDRQRRKAQFFLMTSNFYHQPFVEPQRTHLEFHCKSPGTTMAIMVATYVPHLQFYNHLIASVHKHMGNQTIDLVTVFSSEEECKYMSKKCPACHSASRINMETLIFDYSYGSYNSWVRKVNYQLAKKLWALQHTGHKHVLMLDSDFSILRPVDLSHIFRDYEHVLYEVPALEHNDGFYQGQMQTVGNVLNISCNLVTFETPWLYEQEWVRQLLRFLKERGNGDWIQYVFSLPKPVFEPILYRNFILSRRPDYFDTRIKTTFNWFENLGVTEAQRLALEVPPVGIPCALHQKDPCHTCWLQTYTDRNGICKAVDLIPL